MGSWSVGLYGCDTALDVKAVLDVWLRIPGTADDIVRQMTAGDRRREKSDEDYADFWLALADRFHLYGLDHPETFRRAREVITAGVDLKIKKELGLEARDLKKREAVLSELLERWSKPPKRTLKRVVMKAPEPHAFPTGTIIAYPTSGGEARNYHDRKNATAWKPDGWGSAIILAQGHEKGWFAWSLVGRLSVHGNDKPTFKQCVDGAIETQPDLLNMAGKGTVATRGGSLPPSHAKVMAMEALGLVELDPTKVLELAPDIEQPKQVPIWTLDEIFTWWVQGMKTREYLRDPDLKSPRPAVPLKRLRHMPRY